MSLQTQAVQEIAHFFASSPSPEAIIAFQVSKEVTERLYRLIEAEKAGEISEEEREELDIFEAIDHIMIQTKAEVQQKLLQQAS